MTSLLFGFRPVKRRSNGSVAIPSMPCSRASQRFARRCGTRRTANPWSRRTTKSVCSFVYATLCFILVNPTGEAAPNPDIFRLLLFNRTALSSEARFSGRVCWPCSFTGGRFGWWKESRLFLRMHTLPCGSKYGSINSHESLNKHAITLCGSASWSGRRDAKGARGKSGLQTMMQRPSPAETGSTDLTTDCGLHFIFSGVVSLISLVQNMTIVSDICQHECTSHVSSAPSSARLYAQCRIRCWTPLCQRLQRHAILVSQY